MDSKRLADYIGTDNGAQVAEDLAVAEGLVAGALSTAYRLPDEPMRDRMVLEVGQALHDRRSASSSGAQQYGTLEGAQPARVPRDPLASIRVLLLDYVVPL